MNRREFLGEAAGTAAAFAVERDGAVRSVDPVALRAQLRAAGGYLPEADGIRKS